MKKIYETYTLNLGSVDEIAKRTDEVCKSERVPKDKMIQTRLAVEESLLGWQGKYGDGQELVLRTHRFLFRKMLTVQCKNQDSFNPCSGDEDFDSVYGRSVMSYLKVVPEYSYKGGWNRVTFRLKKAEPQQLLVLLVVIAVACLVGILGKLLIPAGALDVINNNFLTPTYEKFLGVLGCIAGPLIFCSVAWGIYGMGDMATLNRLGKGMIGRLVAAVFIAGACSACGLFFFNVAMGNESVNFSQASDIYQMFLNMIPENIISPLSEGNTLQIIVLAVIIGICLIYLENKTKAVAMAIGQLNSMISFMMELIGKLVPFFIAIVLVHLIWSGSISQVGSSWKFIAVLAGAFVVDMLMMTIITSLRQRVSPLLLVKKVLPAYLIAVTTASSAATFGIMTKNCEEKMGIGKSLTHFGIPIGIILSKTATEITNMLVIFFIAEMYGVELSPSMIIMAVIVTAATSIATPPIPGGGTLAYTVIFTQMGLPMEGLSIVLALDMLIDFLATSTDMYVLQMILLNTAAHYKMVDRKLLEEK